MKSMKLDEITVADEVQCRAALNGATIEAYADRVKAGDKFPAVTVFHDKKKNTYWLADGFHRYEAHKAAGHSEIAVNIQVGDKRAAILHGIEANLKHGLHRSNADKRRCVTMLLADKKWTLWGDSEIAKRCGVSDTFVGDLRTELSSNGPKIAVPKLRKVRRGDREYFMDTTKIGRTNKPLAKARGAVSSAESAIPELASNVIHADFAPKEERSLTDELRTVIDLLESGDNSKESIELMEAVSMKLSKHVQKVLKAA